MRPSSWPQQSYYSSHYAQALQQASSAPATTPQGYTLSSTYKPSLVLHNNVGNARPPPANTPSAAWYQPGNNRCTYKACTFTGSKQSVETHMMDRHLIFPPSWHKRKKTPDWDADPSLKGKNVPIQGTAVVLDTPEALADWVAERKRRWPSAQLVAEKKRKLEEAAARGQLGMEDMGRKRPRTGPGPGEASGSGHRGFGRGGRARGRGGDASWRGRGRGRGSAMPPQQQNARVSSESESSDDDDDSAPEAVSSKVQPTTVVPSPDPPQVDALEAVKHPRPQQPKQPIRNPYASRPTLLRNLLLPEIRITVSNLSQAIRFLVDNDFLQNVELKPGQANTQLIVVEENGGDPLTANKIT